MKITTSTILPVVCCAASLAAAGQVYIYEAPMFKAEHSDHHHSEGSYTLSPTAARLVFAQRAGVEDHHSSDLGAHGVVQAINDYGRRTPLDQTEEKPWRGQAFILLEGIDPTQMGLATPEHSFNISTSPDVRASRGLWVDLVRQVAPQYEADTSDDELYEDMARVPVVQNAKNFFATDIPSKARQYLEHYLGANSIHDTVIYFAPAETSAHSAQTMQPWGTYTMPEQHSSFHKRNAARAPQQEAPLEEQPSKSYQAVQATSAPMSAFASGEPLAGILPSCFSTQSACESATRNCTGHGKCHKAYTDQSGDEKSKSKNCYSCQCSATVQKNDNGRVKTTYWGGPACQKKDVSVEFWMIAIFTVGLVFLVGFAIGQVWDMGSQELPSVIGAGVSGPVKRS